MYIQASAAGTDSTTNARTAPYCVFDVSAYEARQCQSGGVRCRRTHYGRVHKYLLLWLSEQDSHKPGDTAHTVRTSAASTPQPTYATRTCFFANVRLGFTPCAPILQHCSQPHTENGRNAEPDGTVGFEHVRLSLRHQLPNTLHRYESSTMPTGAPCDLVPHAARPTTPPAPAATWSRWLPRLAQLAPCKRQTSLLLWHSRYNAGQLSAQARRAEK